MHPRLASLAALFPQLNTQLTEFGRDIVNKRIYDAIATAQRDIDVDMFIAALPASPTLITGRHIASALETGLNIGNILTTLYDSSTVLLNNTDIFDNVVTADTTHNLKALRRLNSLRADPRFAHLHRYLGQRR